MEPEKKYDPQEQITVTMSRKEWEAVAHWLQFGEDYNAGKMHEYLTNSWMCPAEYGARAMEHRRQSEYAESLRKIVEAVLYPQPAQETEE